MTGGPDRERNARLCLHPHYQHRAAPDHFDDRALRDEWQDAVYRYARGVAVRENARRIVDFGCGSGWKLLKYCSGFETVGYEIDPALSYLRACYPDRVWCDGGGLGEPFVGDMLICADVIEHLLDPVALLQRIVNSPLLLVVLSTPALEILAERGQTPRLGPPDNASHVNEWTTREFGDFVAMHLKVVEHIVVSAQQGTQLILATRP